MKVQVFPVKSAVVTVLAAAPRDPGGGNSHHKSDSVCATLREMFTIGAGTGFLFLFSLYSDFSKCPLLSVKAFSCKGARACMLCKPSIYHLPDRVKTSRLCVFSVLCYCRAEVQPAVVPSTIFTLRSTGFSLARSDHTPQLRLCEISFQEKKGIFFGFCPAPHSQLSVIPEVCQSGLSVSPLLLFFSQLPSTVTERA